MNDTFTTHKNGIELKLKAVDQLSIHNILYRLGVSIGDTKDAIGKTLQDGSKSKIEAISQLFGYCISQGVVTDAPQDAIDELEAMGFPTKNKNVARVHWLRSLELESQEEAGELIGLVMALTFAPKPEEKREFEAAIQDDDEG